MRKSQNNENLLLVNEFVTKLRTVKSLGQTISKCIVSYSTIFIVFEIFCTNTNRKAFFLSWDNIRSEQQKNKFDSCTIKNS